MALRQTESVARPHALPSDLTSFVGRRYELHEVRRLLGSHRLVTVTGPGGIGKTRVALRAAHELGRLFPAGVAFVDLGSLEHGSAIVDALSQALGMRMQSGPWSIDRIAGYIGDRRLLLLADNCEHLLKPFGQGLEQLLRTCPELHAIATSRQPLGIAGEAQLPIPALAEDEATQLFDDRARSIDPSWNARGTNRDDLAELCRRLDGIPLALELAAARISALTIEEITARLDDRLQLFSRRGVSAGPARQQTLQATIDWSYSLLTETERVVWHRLAIFGGDFGLEAAEAVSSGDPIPRADVVELIATLVEKSMLARETVAGASRYRFLETLQRYARERLIGSGEQPAVTKRFVEWVQRLTRDVWQHSWGPDEARWVNRVDREYANVRHALAICGGPGGDVTTGLRILGDLWLFWELRGHLSDASHGLLMLLRADPPDTDVKARAMLSGGMAAQMVEGALSPNARRLLEQAVSTARQANDPATEHRAQAILVFTLLDEGDLARARAVAQQAVDGARQRPQDRMGLAITLLALGTVMRLQDERDPARTIATEAIGICEADGDTLVLAYLLTLLGHLEIKDGKFALAESVVKRSLALRRQLDHRWGMGLAIEPLARIATRQRRLPRAARLLGISDAIFTSLAATRPPSHTRARDEILAEIKATLGPAAAAEALALGRRMPLPEAVGFALEEPAVASAEPPPDEESVLSRRELEVAGLVAEGLSNKQIANRIVVSERTVETHVQHILDKLGANSRTQIASWMTARSAAGR